MVDERGTRTDRQTERFSRRSVLRSTAGIGIGTPFASAAGTAQTSAGEWGDSCDDAPVVDGTGTYTGTLETPDDEQFFKIQINHGESLSVNAFAPTAADNPTITIEAPDATAYTRRNEENVEFEASRYGEWIDLEPGIEGSFELWAEEDTVFCFRVSDGGSGGEYPYDWQFEPALLTSATPDDSWGDSCDDAPVIDGTGQYDGTLVSPGDEHVFKFQLDHGEYLDVDAFAPTGADNPTIAIEAPDATAYTRRNEENVEFEASQYGQWIDLEPGIEGSFELWAEEDTVFCLSVSDGGPGGAFPHDWRFEPELLTSATPDDSWGDSCDDAPVIETTGQYSGTLVSPQDRHYLRFVMEEGDSLTVETLAPSAASDPTIAIEAPDATAYTRRNEENVEFEASRYGEWIDLEPGIEGSFELIAESDTSVCFSVSDGGSGGSFPYEWTFGFNQSLSTAPATGAITGTIDFSDDLLAEPTTNPVTIELHATGGDNSESVDRVVDASSDTSPAEFTLAELPPGEYELTAAVVAVDGDRSRADVVAVSPDESPYEAVTVEENGTTSGYEFTIEKTVASEANLQLSEFSLDDAIVDETFTVPVTVVETAGVPAENLTVSLSITNGSSDSVYEATIDAAPLAADSTTVTFGADEATNEIGPLESDEAEYEATVTADAANADAVSVTETLAVEPAPASPADTATATPTTTPTATEKPADGATPTDTATPTEKSGDEDDEDTVGVSGPGFGVGSVLTAIGGAGYLLKQRLDPGDESE